MENERDDIVDANERAGALLGYSRDELLTMKVPDLQAPEVRGQVGRVIRERIETHGSATFETNFDLHRSGRRIPVEVTISEISHRGENLVLSVVRDITERKRIEAELRARQELLDLAQKAARAVAFDWHIGARESENRWSPELEAMYGLEPGTFDRTSDGWKQLVHPDDGGGKGRDQAVPRNRVMSRPSTGSFTRMAPCAGCGGKGACSSTPRANPSGWSAS